MSTLRVGYLALAFSLSGLVTTALAADEKCYEPKLIPASMSCAGNQSTSADFQSGCTYVAEHTEQKEIECPVGEWVNVAQETRMSENGVSITQAAICKTAGMVSYNIDGKTCASGERPPTIGNGWQFINYRYGKKGGGNGKDGGERLETFRSSGISGGMDNGYESTMIGTMCYDRSQGTKNNTKEDAVVAVYCK